MCLLTDPYSSPLLFMARYRPLSTPLMLTSPTARLMNSKIPENTDALYVNAMQLLKKMTVTRIAPNLYMRKIGFEAVLGVKYSDGPATVLSTDIQYSWCQRAAVKTSMYIR